MVAQLAQTPHEDRQDMLSCDITAQHGNFPTRFSAEKVLCWLCILVSSSYAAPHTYSFLLPKLWTDPTTSPLPRHIVSHKHTAPRSIQH